MESYEVGCTDLCSMTVVAHLGADCALNDPSMSRMTSLTRSLSVIFVSSSGFAFSFHCNRPENTKFICRQLTGFGVRKVRMARMTLAHTPTNYRISHIGQ